MENHIVKIDILVTELEETTDRLVNLKITRDKTKLTLNKLKVLLDNKTLSSTKRTDYTIKYDNMLKSYNKVEKFIPELEKSVNTLETTIQKLKSCDYLTMQEALKQKVNKVISIEELQMPKKERK
jgi:uncharacterized Fe-S cluster-containing radical SAM superfamily enzyme